MVEQKFTRFLLSLDRSQQRLAEFMLGRCLEFDFSGDSEFVHRMEGEPDWDWRW